MYPGNDYVDIVGFDNYGIKESTVEKTKKQLKLLSDFAKQNKKVAA